MKRRVTVRYPDGTIEDHYVDRASRLTIDCTSRIDFSGGDRISRTFTVAIEPEPKPKKSRLRELGRWLQGWL